MPSARAAVRLASTEVADESRTRTSEAAVAPLTFTRVTAFEQARVTLPIDPIESTVQDRTTVTLTDSGAEAVAASIVPVRAPAVAMATTT